MRNTVAKRLRKAARQELLLDNVPNRDLVMGTNSVINSPESIRALYLKLKRHWVLPVLSTPALVITRLRKRSGFHRLQDMREPPAWIAHPLRALRNRFHSFVGDSGKREQNAVVRMATGWARAGRGDKVHRLALDLA